MADKPTTTPKPAQFLEGPDFAAAYANFTRFEPAMWDLKLTFGEVREVNDEGGLVENHTAITLAWGAAKVMALYLALNIALHERQNGTIKIYEAVMQPDIQHLVGLPIEELIAEAIKIRATPTSESPSLPPAKKL